MWVLSIIELALLTQLLLTNFSLRKLAVNFFEDTYEWRKKLIERNFEWHTKKSTFGKKINPFNIAILRSQAVLDQIKTSDIKTSICSYTFRAINER